MNIQTDIFTGHRHSPARIVTNTYDLGTTADPNDVWIYETVYEWSVPVSAFGASGYGGGITISEVHNSPVKSGNPVPVPVITVSKTSDPASGSDVLGGQSILYTVTASNSGALALTDVVISDVIDTNLTNVVPLDGGSYDGGSRTVTWPSIPVFSPGDAVSVQFQADVIVATAVGTQIFNTGKISSPDLPTDVFTNTTVHNVVGGPAIELIKSGSLDLGADGIANPGDVISYTFTVTNTGSVTLSGVTVTDPLLTVSGGPITLAPGASDSTTFTGTYAITQADIDAGERDNLATAIGSPPAGGPVSDDDPHNEPVPAAPSIELIKSGSLDLGADGIANPGDVISYTFTVTNTGNVTLSGVTVTDPLLTVSGGPITLAPGASDSTTFTGTYAITQADIDAGERDNLATAIGSPPAGGPVSDDDPHNEPVPAAPSIELIKSGSLDLGADGIANPGDVISYTFTVTNTGNVTLSGVTVTDPLLTVSGGPITLAPGASDSTTFTGTYAITQADIDAGERDNLATAIGSPPAGGPVSDDDPHNEPVPAAPSIELIKSGSLDLGADGIANPGDVISYTFTVTNTGNVTLSGVTVTDPLLTVSGGPITLAPGASDSTTFTGTYAITQADIDAGERDNLATAIGSPPAGGPVSDDDPHNEPVPAAPSIELIKSGSLDLGADGIANPGDVISYTFTVTNTGNVTLSGVTVTDPLLTVSGGPITLAPGASDSTTFTGTYAITQADIDAGERDNLATAIGSPPAGGPVSDDDPHNEPVPAAPSIELIKSGSLDLGADGIANPGDVISYTFTVTNTGNVTLSGVTVTDPLLTVSGGPITLAPGASDSTTFTGTYAITQADIDAGERDNLATAIGSPPAGGPVSDDDPHNEPIPAPPPDVTVSKTAVSATIVVGEEAIFSITVTNDGPGAAVGVTLTDNLPAVSGTWILGGTDAADCLIAVDGTSLTCSFGDLGSGASKSFNVSTVTDSADCDPASNSFSLPNTATVAATNEPASATGNNSDSDTITVSCPGALFIILDEDGYRQRQPAVLD